MHRVALGCVMFAIVSQGVRAAELEQIPNDWAVGLGRKFVELASQRADAPLAIDAVPEKANGWHLPDEVGLLLVPQADVKETEEWAAKFKSETGAALGYLFLYHVAPIVNGQRLPADQLPAITIEAEGGPARRVAVLRLAVKQPAEDDYRLLVYGEGKTPLFDVSFAQSANEGGDSVTVAVKELDEEKQEGTVVVTVFGKYQASFRGGAAQ